MNRTNECFELQTRTATGDRLVKVLSSVSPWATEAHFPGGSFPLRLWMY
jgi:hypothetical protein